MTPGTVLRNRLARWSLTAALFAGCALPAAAGATPVAPPGSKLSPRLAEVARPALRSASAAAIAKRLSLPRSGPGSLERQGRRAIVDVRFDGGAGASLGRLRATGAEVLHVSSRFQTVTVAAMPGQLEAIGRLAGVAGVTGVLAPIVRGADCGGSVVSEGDSQLNADNARASFNIDGGGVTVGLLSDSFNRDGLAFTHAPEDVASGDLPGPGSPCGSSTPVGDLNDSDASGLDEGRAMAQVVHDLAPGAAIDFATAFPSETAFASNIRALQRAGASVIADDVAYLEEPFFQDGPVANAVNEAAAAGVSFFSAAGNDNLIDSEGHDIASWEAPEYRDTGACPTAIAELSEEVEEVEEEKGNPTPVGLHPSHCMGFKPGAAEDDTFGIEVEEGAGLTIDLQWAEPRFGVNTDLDAFLLDEEGKVVKAEGNPVVSVERNVTKTQQPFEYLFWHNTGEEKEVRLVINRFSEEEAKPRLKFALLENGRGVTGTEYDESSEGDVVGPTVFGHSGAAGAVAVGAVPYNDSSAPETYSSHGPVTHYFGPVTGTVAAKPIVRQEIPKPDVAATDCGVTTFFFQPFPSALPPFRFCGTSAAAPHAAGVAALLRQANPGASVGQVRAALVGTSRPVGAFGPDAVGAGLVDAFGAVKALALPPTITITKAPPALSRNRRPEFEFSANRPVAFHCSVDGGQPQLCASPFSVPADLADGTHGFAVTGTDLAGREGSSGTVSFRIDTKAPRTRFAKHPPKLLRTRHRRAKAIFLLKSNEAPVKFACKVDRGLLRFCGPRLARRFSVGRHVVQVRAQDEAGNVDRTPAVFHFRVERVG
jgi:subtilase family protein